MLTSSMKSGILPNLILLKIFICENGGLFLSSHINYFLIFQTIIIFIIIDHLLARKEGERKNEL